MTGEQWPTRVFDAAQPAGGGSGFLISDQQVMTCAHVVDGMAKPTVRFPARSDLGDLPAVMEYQGSWRRNGDNKGDIAILRLSKPVPIAPARFAARNALDLPQPLVVLGFPRTNDGRARIAMVEATAPRLLIDDEWVQLQSSHGFGPVVGKGYSGAAVVLRATGEVVGMITAAELADRLGHMLPTTRLLDHWPTLSDLLPLGPLTAASHASLRGLLARVPVDAARTAARLAVEEDLGPELDHNSLDTADSAYAVAIYLAENLYWDRSDENRPRTVLLEFCRQLIREVTDQDVTTALRGWLDLHSPGRTIRERPPERPAEVTLCVQVARSGSGPGNVLLSVRLRSGSTMLREVFSDVVPRGKLRTQVQDLLPATITGHVPRGCRVGVEFVLPRGWLSYPVDTWTLGSRSVVRVGWRHPVTVRDLARSQQAAADWEHDRRWSQLHQAGHSDDAVYWISCRDTVDASKLAAALAHEAQRALLALAVPPVPPANHPAIRAAFDSGVPVMLWRRDGCPPDCDATAMCQGMSFQADMMRRLAEFSGSAGLVKLPELLRQLRAEAGQSGDEMHCGHAVTLLWDPPGERPLAPPLRMAYEVR